MRTLLFILVCFVAITSLVSGILIITHPDGSVMQMSVDLLKTSPFKNFLVPGIVLTVLVGGTNLLAAFFNMKRSANRYNWALAGGVMISGWTVVQMILINTIFWLQFVYLGIGIVIMLIAYQLKGKALI
ncbi:MAG: hypothetical protein IPP96_06510 [Chitinophagaceae bacterium]|nr:hypothetical protein [Chitinophagaceae bacterium]